MLVKIQCLIIKVVDVFGWSYYMVAVLYFKVSISGQVNCFRLMLCKVARREKLKEMLQRQSAVVSEPESLALGSINVIQVSADAPTAPPPPLPALPPGIVPPLLPPPPGMLPSYEFAFLRLLLIYLVLHESRVISAHIYCPIILSTFPGRCSLPLGKIPHISVIFPKGFVPSMMVPGTVPAMMRLPPPMMHGPMPPGMAAPPPPSSRPALPATTSTLVSQFIRQIASIVIGGHLG